MSITDELRYSIEEAEQVYGCECKHLLALADRIDMEHERLMVERADQYSELRAKVNNCYIELPKDADGEYIHIGDEMETERFGVVEVEGFIHNAIAFNVYDPQPARICTVPANQCRHYHVLTVEDVLREFTDAILEWAVKSGTIVEVGTWSDVAAEYAAKLQLKEN